MTREQNSAASGYFPAWKAFELKDTFGLPLLVCAVECLKHSLKMDWHGIEYEFSKRGIDGRSEIEEAKKETYMFGYGKT